MELPITRFDENNLLHNKIFTNTAKLICTTSEYSKLRKSIGIPDYVVDSDERIMLEAQINASVAKIYDLVKDDLRFILENFPIADKNLKELTLNEFMKLE